LSKKWKSGTPTESRRKESDEKIIISRPSVLFRLYPDMGENVLKLKKYRFLGSIDVLVFNNYVVI